MVEELRAKFTAAQEHMKVDHRMAQALLSHSGNKGTRYELAFRRALTSCLPVNLQFGHGEVIDSLGHRSNQTDVVIVSHDHPGTFVADLPELFYVEAVLAAGEVKAILTSGELESTLEKSRIFKRMQVVEQTGALVLGDPDKDRYFRCPPNFLFAYESQLKLETLRERILAFETNAGLRLGELLDAVFVLDQGWLINFGDGNERFKFKTPEGRFMPGWVGQQSDDVLLNLITWLSLVMPQRIYIPPLLQTYLRP